MDLQERNSSKKNSFKIMGEFRNLQIYKHGYKGKIRENKETFELDCNLEQVGNGA